MLHALPTEQLLSLGFDETRISAIRASAPESGAPPLPKVPASTPESGAPASSPAKVVARVSKRERKRAGLK